MVDCHTHALRRGHVPHRFATKPLLEDPRSLSGAIRDASNPLVVMRRVVDQAVALIPAADGAVVELVRDQHLNYVCAGGTLVDHVGVRQPIGHSLSGLAVSTRETLYAADCESDPRVDREVCRMIGAGSMVSVPLTRGADSIGALKVIARKPRSFTSADVMILSRLGGFISAAVGAASDIARTAAELFESIPYPADAASVDRPAPFDQAAQRGIGEFVANVLRPGIVTSAEARQRIERVLAEQSFRIVCQPVLDLETGRLVGLEALTRFPAPPRQPAEVWFSEAQQVALGVKLQLAVAQTALRLVDRIPEGIFLAINLGPDAVASRALPVVLDLTPDPSRIVIELTEHLDVADYPHLRRVLQEIRMSGTRLAIDDTGAGFASLSHIVNLAPDLIKLDRQFTLGIDVDPVRRSLARALVSFAEETGAVVIAEGIETADELATVRELGIPYGQGYFIGRPGPVKAVVAHFTDAAGGR